MRKSFFLAALIFAFLAPPALGQDICASNPTDACCAAFGDDLPSESYHPILSARLLGTGGYIQFMEIDNSGVANSGQHILCGKPVLSDVKLQIDEIRPDGTLLKIVRQASGDDLTIGESGFPYDQVSVYADGGIALNADKAGQLALRIDNASGSSAADAAIQFSAFATDFTLGIEASGNDFEICPANLLGGAGCVEVQGSGDVALDGLEVRDLSASRLVASNGSDVLTSTDADAWIAGTANQVTVTDDGDGSVTISLPNVVEPSSESSQLGKTISAGGKRWGEIFATPPASSSTTALCLSGGEQIVQCAISSEKVKENWRELDFDPDRLFQLGKPKSFDYKESDAALRFVRDGKAGFGWSAEDLEPLGVPGLVSSSKTVNYAVLVPVLIGRISELMSRLDAVEEELQNSQDHRGQ